MLQKRLRALTNVNHFQLFVNFSFTQEFSSNSGETNNSSWKKYTFTRSLGALRAPTSSLRPFGPALGPSGLLDNVLHALRALRPCDPHNSAMMG